MDDRSATAANRHMTRTDAARAPPRAPVAAVGAVIRVGPDSARRPVQGAAVPRDGRGADDDDPWGFLGPIPGP